MGLLANFDLTRLLKAYGYARSTPDDGQLLPAPRPVVTLTTPTFVVTPAHKCGTLFTNRGLGGASAVTLPAPTAVPVGTWYTFRGVVAQNIVVAAPTVDTLVVVNDAAATSLALQTAGQIIGAELHVECDGTQWFAQVRTNIPGGTTAVTSTAVL